VLLKKTNRERFESALKGGKCQWIMQTTKKSSVSESKESLSRQSQRIQPLLFQSKDIRKFVSEFVSSWIRGDIIIRFPTAAELAKKTPLSIAFPTDPSVNAELKIKEHYVDLLSIVAGIKPASVEEQKRQSMKFSRCYSCSDSANRIEGKIMSNDLEKRIKTSKKPVQTKLNLLSK
jgi:hypothetical protein